MGMVARYPQVDLETITAVVEAPTILLQDGYLETIQHVHIDLREGLTKALVKCVSPDHNLATAVEALNKAMQREMTIASLLTAANGNRETITPL